MLKWAVPSQRKSIIGHKTDSVTGSHTSDSSNHETCSNASSDSSSSSSEASYDLSVVPIRYHERRRASRPKSLAIFFQDSSMVSDLEKIDSLNLRKTVTHRTASSPLNASSRRSNRHSVHITPSQDSADNHRRKSHTLDSMHAYRHTPSKLSVYQPSSETTTTEEGKELETDTGVLKISTGGIDKTKSSRNSFWKSLRLKAQGKNKDKKLAKAHSLSNLPGTQTLISTDVYTDTQAVSQPPTQILSVSASSTPAAAPHDISPSYRSRSSVLRRRSLKILKKENEHKKPKRFSKTLDFPEPELLSSSPDSGVSSLRINSTDSDNPPTGPSSPITPIHLQLSEPTELPCIKQQFTDAVLQYLNDRLETKGYSSIGSVSSSCSTRSSRSDDGSADVFCYDTDTVLRRPHHHNNNDTRAIKANF